MKASTAIPTVDSGHFEKRKRDRRAGNSKAGNVPNSQLSRRQDNAIDGSMDWQDIAVDWRRCESMYIAWSGGHGPFNINATSYPDNANGDASTGLEWQIANLVGNHNYFWTAKAPANTTYYFDLEDTSNGQRVSSLLRIHINSGIAEGITSCPVDYSNAVNITGDVTIATSSILSSGSTSSSTIMGSTQSTASSETEGNGTTSSQSTISEKTAKALYAILSILLIALLAMVFMQYRLRKRLARLQKGQSTVGRWMNHHDFDFENNRMKPRKGSPSSENEEDMRSMSSSNNLYIASGSSGQQPNSTSAFHHNRSSSSSTHISRSSSTSTTRRRPTSLSSNPFADDAQELDEEDIIHRSASQAKRHSHAESSISDSNTIMTSDTFTSSSGRLSSIAPSDQQSSIGNVSVVSDDHYHRAKAFTITRGNGLPSTTGLGRGEFLDPHSVFMESRR